MAKEKVAPPVNPGLVVLVNLTNTERDVTLYDGTNLSMGPFDKSGRYNTSVPVLRKLLPPYVARWESNREIRIISAGGAA